MTKLGEAMAAGNIHYGRPSAAKQREREQGAKLWAQGMTLLRGIRDEVEAELRAVWRAQDADEWLRGLRKRELIAK